MREGGGGEGGPPPDQKNVSLRGEAGADKNEGGGWGGTTPACTKAQKSQCLTFGKVNPGPPQTDIFLERGRGSRHNHIFTRGFVHKQDLIIGNLITPVTVGVQIVVSGIELSTGSCSTPFPGGDDSRFFQRWQTFGLTARVDRATCHSSFGIVCRRLSCGLLTRTIGSPSASVSSGSNGGSQSGRPVPIVSSAGPFVAATDGFGAVSSTVGVSSGTIGIGAVA